MITGLIVCSIAFVWLIWLVLDRRVSLGLPIAYLFGLLLIHVPGALAYMFSGDHLLHMNETRIGFNYASIAAACFVIGVSLASKKRGNAGLRILYAESYFQYFCLVGGWAFVYILSPLHSIPSVGAVIDEAGALWLLGVMLGLREGIARASVTKTLFWGSALMVYPVVMLILGGFLSYGSAAVIIVASGVLASARNRAHAFLGVALVAFFGLSLFVNYFSHRGAIRSEVWGGASLSDRLESVDSMFVNFQLFDPRDLKQAESLDVRLNQNYFVGLAAERIEQGQTEYLLGRSVWEAVIALVPRAIWPEKPVGAGSGNIVRDVTGLHISKSTSWGVGNVMELQINFGLPGVILGFLLLGWSIGTLDLRAGAAIVRGDYGRSILYFLPAVALIQPNGSMVELAAGSASALVAGYGWNYLWQRWRRHKAPRRILLSSPAFAKGHGTTTVDAARRRGGAQGAELRLRRATGAGLQGE
jgi:hypothetical protein